MTQDNDLVKLKCKEGRVLKMQIIIYQLSGILMLLGVYFTIKYRPYCTLKSPEREIAMELNRKKLLKEKISFEDKNKLSKYLTQTIKYSFGDFILFIGILVHIAIFAGNEWYNLSPLYYLSMALVVIVIVRKGYLMPFCFEPFLAMLLWNNKETELKILNIYHKKNNGDRLDTSTLKTYKPEAYLYKYEEEEFKFFLFSRFSVNFGVILHLVLDTFFGLIGGLVIH